MTNPRSSIQTVACIITLTALSLLASACESKDVRAIAAGLNAVAAQQQRDQNPSIWDWLANELDH